MFRTPDQLRSRDRRAIPGEDGGRGGSRYIEVGGGGSVRRSSDTRLAKITGRAGTQAPWLYTGVPVEHDGSDDYDPANYSEVDNGDNLAWRLVNENEIGADGAGVNPVSDDSIVSYRQEGATFYFTKSNYKGTY